MKQTKLEKRISSILKCIRDSCPNCLDRGILCAVHLKDAIELAQHPLKTLKKLEAKYSGNNKST